MKVCASYIAAAGAALIASGCDGGPSGPETVAPGLVVVSGAAGPDTIQTVRAEPLVVQVADSAGRVRAGVVVRFEAVPDPVSRATWLDVAGAETQPYRTSVDATTDARGRAEVRVRFGALAGSHPLAITVPELGYRDTARFAVTAGAAVRVVAAPADSAVYVGRGYTLRAATADRFLNPRTDPVTYELARGPATVSGATVTGVSTGRAAVVARAGSFADTSYVSVVPPGVLAAQAYDPGNGGPIGLALLQMDGSEYRIIASGIDNRGVPHGLDWSPDGRELVFTRENRVRLLVPGGGERTLAELSAPVGGARFAPNGAALYLGVGPRAGTGSSLYRLNADGTGAMRIGEPATSAGEEFNPSPSPDGRSLAYVSLRTPCGVERCIRVLDLATGRDTNFRVTGRHAAWSPTDDRIAIATERSILLVRADGTGTRVLAERILNVTWMDWSPDGRWIVVGSHTQPVTLIDTQSGDVLPLAFLASHGEAAWRP
ncbi:MAG TPA: hypothetical protein VF613_12230 [Longimicrobium sp.]|jgi:hypothetical protein